ncbi:MAG: hydroxyacid dehydrogenase [Hyphomicrobiales bacterium]
MTDCVIVQPIHEAGLRLLCDAGLSYRVAENAGLATLEPHLADARAVITRNAGFSAEAIAASPKLRVIGSHGTGVDAIDLAAAQARGIVVVNTPGANAQSVAELAFALIFACAKRIPAADQAVRQGDFAFRYWSTTSELHGKVLGLVGFGRVARRMAALGRAFGMEVVAWSQHASAAEIEREGARPMATLNELCANADILSLHTLPKGTLLFDVATFARLKPSAILVNTARGALVDEAALVAALRSGQLAAAGLDVFDAEPPDARSPLFDAPNLVMTPHIGGSTQEALERTACEVAQDVISVLRGEHPANPVTSRAGA